MKQTLITNAQVATSREVFPGAVLVQGERIAHVFRRGEEPPAPAGDTHILDAGGGYLLPGGVDAHTHFDLDVGFTRASDDFYTGSVAAACGGTTTVIDHMAFGPKGASLTHQPAVYRELAKPAVIDYGFHGVIQHVNDDVLRDMAVLRDDGITSLKLYMTYDDKINDAGILQVLRRAGELGLVLCCHCENDDAVTGLRRRFVREGKTQARYHPLSRPAAAEAEAVFRLMMLAKIERDAAVYIVHLSSGLGLSAIRAARAAGQKNILAETCPQYLFLDDALYQDDQEGLKYIMSPPLRKKSDGDALWQGLAEGDIQTIGTDHCPFFFSTQKQRGARDFTLCPNGAPGVELRMPLLFSEGFLKGRLSLPQLVRACCTRPARVFGLPQKGDIAPGADADLALFSAGEEWVVRKDDLHENVDYTPYEGLRLQSRVRWTMARGRIVAENGAFTGRRGAGRYLKRGPGAVQPE